MSINLIDNTMIEEMESIGNAPVFVPERGGGQSLERLPLFAPGARNSVLDTSRSVRITDT